MPALFPPPSLISSSEKFWFIYKHTEKPPILFFLFCAWVIYDLLVQQK